MDAMAKRKGNENIQFIHASPGFVNSNWGTEMPWFLRYPIRGMQNLMGMSPTKCAENMCDPIIKSINACSTCNSTGNEFDSLFMNSSRKQGLEPRIFILKEDSTEGKLTNAHTEEAMKTILWDFTAEILGKVGIDINNKS